MIYFVAATDFGWDRGQRRQSPVSGPLAMRPGAVNQQGPVRQIRTPIEVHCRTTGRPAGCRRIAFRLTKTELCFYTFNFVGHVLIPVRARPEFQSGGDSRGAHAVDRFVAAPDGGKHRIPIHRSRELRLSTQTSSSGNNRQLACRQNCAISLALLWWSRCR